MQRYFKFFLSIFLFIFSLVLLLIFKSVPSSQSLDNYRILYIDKTKISENEVISILSKNEIDNVISKSAQCSNVFDSYFCDESNQYSLFYIEDSKSSSLKNVVLELRNLGIEKVGVDGSGVYNIFIPLFCVLFFLFLIVFSNCRIEFFFEVILFVILVFSRPFHIVAVGSCISMFGMFLLLKRKKIGFDFIYELKKSIENKDFSLVSFLFLSIFPVVLVAFSDFVSSFFYILVVFSSLFEFYVFDVSKFSIKIIKFVRKSLIRKIGILILLIFSFFVGKIFEKAKNSNTIEIESSTQPALPTVVDAEKADLPKLFDYSIFEWKNKTSLYIPIAFEENNYIPTENEKISITDYSEVDGKIIAEEKVLFTFNEEFRKEIYSDLLKSDTSFGNVLLSQKTDSFAYSVSSSGKSSAFKKSDIILLIAFLLILLVFAGYHIFLNLIFLKNQKFLKNRKN